MKRMKISGNISIFTIFFLTSSVFGESKKSKFENTDDKISTNINDYSLRKHVEKLNSYKSSFNQRYLNYFQIGNETDYDYIFKHIGIFKANFSRNNIFLNTSEKIKKEIIYLHDTNTLMMDSVIGGAWKDKMQRQKLENKFINSSSYYENKNLNVKTLDLKFFKYILSKLKENHNYCKSTESIQMSFVKFHNLLMSILLENYAAVSLFSIYRHDQLLEIKKSPKGIVNDGYMNNINQILQNLKKVAYSLTSTVFSIMIDAPSNVRRCDPYRHKKHITYEPLTNLIQGWVGGEEFLNPQHKCGYNCLFDKTKFHGINYNNTSQNNVIGNFDKNFIYNGTLYDCTAAPPLNLVAQQINPPNNERIYAYLSLKDGSRTVAQWGKSNIYSLYTMKHFTDKDLRHWSRTKIDNVSSTCSMCLCYLDHENHKPNSTRAFSAVPVSVPRGWIVTGVRWIVRNNVVHLELRGNKVIQNYVIPSSEQWFNEFFKEQTDTIYLKAEQRSLCLENVMVPPNMVVVGAAFELINGLICLSLQGVKINETDGNLLSELGHFSLANDIRKGEELRLYHPDASHWAPTDHVHCNEERSVPGGNFVNFQPTNFRKDAAQTTVPYLDIQEVLTDPPTPLQGLGIYYKGVEEFGGFVGFKLLTALSLPRMSHEFEKIKYFDF